MDNVYRPVLTKRDFVRRYNTGEFGNRSPTWETLDELMNSGYPENQLIHIRNRIAGGPTWYDIPLRYVPATLREVGNPAGVYFSAMAPTSKTLFQGEVLQTDVGLSLLWTDVAKPMRDALRDKSVQEYGISAVERLRYWLCPKSYDWLETLLTRYPFHVVEFSTFSVEFGTLPGYNTVFWEVRLY